MLGSPWCSSSSQSVPKGVPNSTSFLSHILSPKISLSHLCRWTQRRGTLSWHRNCNLGETPMFSIRFQYVPQVPNVFSHMFSITPHFYPICFGKCCPPFTYIAGPKERNSIFQNKTFYSGEVPYFLFSQWWTNRIGSLWKNKIWTWEAPHLVNRRGK